MKGEYEIPQIDQKELNSRLQGQKTILIDVREEAEFKEFNIGGINIPAHLLNENLSKLSSYETIIVACSNGTRSHIISRVLKKKLPGKEILHLKEGLF
jgi:rhodanese-related sulfurtransferase